MHITLSAAINSCLIFHISEWLVSSISSKWKWTSRNCENTSPEQCTCWCFWWGNYVETSELLFWFYQLYSVFSNKIIAWKYNILLLWKLCKQLSVIMVSVCLSTCLFRSVSLHFPAWLVLYIGMNVDPIKRLSQSHNWILTVCLVYHGLMGLKTTLPVHLYLEATVLTNFSAQFQAIFCYSQSICTIEI